MTNFVLAAAPTLTPPLPVWESMSQTWTGFDGTTFALDVDSAGVCLLLDGVNGLHFPEFDQYLDEYAGVDGARYRGERAKSRSVDWTLGVFGDSSAQWLERDRAFWRTIRPGKSGEWRVYLPDGSSRWLPLRYRDASPYSYDRDPLKAGWAVYNVSMLAEQPFWRGDAVESPKWGIVDDPIPFTGPDDEAPDFYISSATSTGTATLTNEGDVPASLTWVFEGRGSGLDSVSVDGTAGSLGFGEIAAGSVLTITTDPTRPLALLDGVDVTGEVSPWDPRQIAEGQSVDLGIDLVGQGTAQAFFTPLYLRAF